MLLACLLLFHEIGGGNETGIFFSYDSPELAGVAVAFGLDIPLLMIST